MHIRLPLRRFMRPSRPDPSLPVPNPDDIRPIPSPNHPDTQLVRPDRQTILAQWQQLGALVPRSHDYAQLLRRLVDVEANRNLALELIDDDASIVINAIGEVSSFCPPCLNSSHLPTCASIHHQALRTSMLQSNLAHHSFSLLRKLAGKTGRLPVKYLVSKDADYQVEATIFASGGFADVRKGKLGKRAVAVKTIRVAQDGDIFKIRKASTLPRAPFPGSNNMRVPSVLGFLQGIGALDASFPPQCLGTSCGRYRPPEWNIFSYFGAYG